MITDCYLRRQCVQPEEPARGRWARSMPALVGLGCTLFLLAAILPHRAVAQDDTTPPSFAGTPSIDPATVNVSTGEQIVTVTIPLQDDLSGVDYVSMTFSLEGVGAFSACSTTLVSGDALEGVWEAVCRVAPERANGDWSILVYVRDEAGNAESLSADLTLTITGGDSTPPALAGVPSVTPTDVDLSESEQNVTIMLPLMDEGRGVEKIYSVSFDREGSGLYGNSCDGGTLISGDAFEGTWEVVCTIPRSWPDGFYMIEPWPQDSLGNRERIETALQVTISGGDTEPPTLVGTPTLDPQTIDLSSGDVEVTVTAVVDDPSGVDEVRMRLRSGSGQIRYGPVATLIDGTAESGTWQAIITLPQNAEAGELTLHVYVEDGLRNNAEINSGQVLTIGGGDLEPPTLPSPPVLNPASLALAEGGGTVTIDLIVEDAGTGVASVTTALQPESGAQRTSAAQRISGDAQSGMWQAEIQLPWNVPNGSWALTVTVRDEAGNQTTHDPGVALTVTGGDTEPPILTGSPTIAEGDDIHDRLVTLSVQDDVSGVDRVQVWLRDEQAKNTPITFATLTDGAAQNGTWQAILDASALSRGAATLLVTLWDIAGNRNANIDMAVTTVVDGPPDLIVSDLQLSDDPRSGGPLTVTWTVTNQGQGPTIVPEWTDYVWLSTDLDLRRGGDTKLATRSNLFPLESGESYTQSAEVTLPEDAVGTYYLFVSTDNDDAYITGTGGRNSHSNGTVKETDEQNNFAYELFDAALTPPPDLQVTAVQAPPEAFSGQQVTVSWSVANEGEGTIVEGSWVDVLYLSEDDELDGDDLRLGQIATGGTFFSGEGYDTSHTVTLPLERDGTHHLLVVTDENERVFEHTLDGNNAQPSDPITITLAPPPDLQVTAITPQDPPRSGGVLRVQWTVHNRGAGETATPLWYDAIYLSEAPTFDAETAVPLGKRLVGGTLGPDDGYTDSLEVTLPDGIEGTYYLHVVTDDQSVVFEYDQEDNNASAVEVGVTLTPPPDLVVTQVTAPADAGAGTSVLVQWTVQNQSTLGVATGSWKDRIYLATGSDPDTAQAVPLASVPAGGPLPPETGYTREAGVTLPGDLGGTYYVFVYSDIENTVYEHDGEDNNAGTGTNTPLAVEAYPPVDLAVTDVAVPDEAASGQSLTLAWAVVNQGQAPPLANHWVDAAYLSADATLDDDDTLLNETDHSGILAPDDRYAYEQTVTVPDGIEGDQYLLFVTDRAGAVYDAAPANNQHAVAVAVTLTPPPDLVVTTLDAPDDVQAGQRISVAWTVENAGAGTAEAPWRDVLYLSKSDRINQNAIQLATVEHDGDLASDAAYTVTFDADLPGHAGGLYYLVAETDRGDAVYEHEGESNNSRAAVMNLSLAPPADLVVSGITVPGGGVPGEVVTIGWTLANEGTNPATGSLRQAVYLSTDAAWDLADPLLGLVDQVIDLEPGANLSMQLASKLAHTFVADAEGNITATMPGLMPGDYHVIVRANLRESIRETDYNNNRTTSETTLPVEILPLEAGTDVPLAMGPGSAYYARLDVPAGVDVALSLTRTFADIDLAGLYVKYDAIPSRSDHDDYVLAATPRREIVLPARSEAATIYVLAYVDDAPSEAAAYTLHADLLGFDVSGIEPAYGGNAGVVTVLVDGAQFNEETEVALRSPDGDELAPFEFYVVNTTLIRARFDLRGQVPGPYDVLARTGAQEAVHHEIFEVLQGGSARPRVYLQYPEVFRPFEPLRVHLTLVNEGEINALDYVLAFYAPPDIHIEPQNPEEWVPDFPDRPPVAPPEGPYYFQAAGANILPIQVFELPPGDQVDLALNLIGDRAIGNTVYFNAQVIKLPRSQYTETGRIADVATSEGFKHLVNLLTVAIEASDAGGGAGKADDDCSTPADVSDLVKDFLSAAGLTPSSALKSLATTLVGLIGSAVGGPKGIAAAFAAEVYSAYGYVTGLDDLFRELFDKIQSELERAKRCREEKEQPPPPPPPGNSEPPGWTCTAQGCTKDPPEDEDQDDGGSTPTGSRDPNDMLGPAGFGAERWVGLGAPLPYTIRFENDSTVANGPAQVVTIEHALDADLDVGSFRLGAFGFAGHTFTVPEQRAFYTARLDVRDTLEVFVDVTAGLDVVRRRAFWTFRSVDPATGQPPRDPRVGLLPVNNDAGAGQGFVTYSVRPDPSAATGARIEAQATIVFDQNDPIDTPPIFNTIDATAPTSQISAAPTGLSETSSTVAWTGTDGDAGSGLASYTLYASIDGRPFTAVEVGIAGTETTFTGEDGHTYRFFVLATDHAGNEEAFKDAPETYTLVGATTAVRPGDTDGDGIVNEQDVLPIGAYFEARGPVRVGQAADWEAQAVLVWEPEAAAAADANGDGVVDEGDVLVVGTHFGNSAQAGKGRAARQGAILIPPLPPGTTFPIHLVAGTEDVPVDGILGAALRLQLPPELELVTVVPAEALASEPHTLLRMDRSDLETGRIAAAYTRTARQGGTAPVDGAPLVTATVEVVRFMEGSVEVVMEEGTATVVGGAWIEAGLLRLESPEAVEVPATLHLDPNYPNPFNPVTTIRFAVPEASPVTLEVYDILGRRVALILDREERPAGWHALQFDASRLASGVYFYRVRTGDQLRVRKMLLVK